MSEKQVNREDLPDDYKEMMEKESHHDHVIIMTDDGVLRWKESPALRDQIDKCGGLNEVIPMFWYLGWDKNSEQYREMYRKIGYSLSGYWEIFHWEMNNPECENYKQYVLTPFDGKK